MLRDFSSGPLAPLTQLEVFKSYGVLVGLAVAARGFSFWAVVLMARHLGPTGYGEVGFAQATVAYGVTCVAFGLTIYGVRGALRHPGTMGRLTSSIISIRLTLAVAAFLVLMGVAQLPAFVGVSDLIALYGLTLVSNAISVVWVAQASQRMDVVGLSNLVTQILFVSLLFAGFRAGLGTYAVPLALATSELVVAGGLLVWMTRTVGRLRRPFDLSGCFAIVKKAAPIAGSQLLRIVAIGSDLVILGLFVALADVGHYNAAYVFFVLGFTLVALYVTVVLPHLVRHGIGSSASVSRETGSLLAKVLWLALPAAVVGFLLAPWVLDTFFGAEFAPAVTPMRWLILAVLASLVAGHYRPAVLALGRNTMDLRNVAVASSTHVLCKVALIPALGITGAAVGTFLGETVFALCSWLTLRRLVRNDAAGGATGEGSGERGEGVANPDAPTIGPPTAP